MIILIQKLTVVGLLLITRTGSFKTYIHNLIPRRCVQRYQYYWWKWHLHGMICHVAHARVSVLARKVLLSEWSNYFWNMKFNTYKLNVCLNITSDNLCYIMTLLNHFCNLFCSIYNIVVKCFCATKKLLLLLVSFQLILFNSNLFKKNLYWIQCIRDTFCSDTYDLLRCHLSFDLSKIWDRFKSGDLTLE